MDDDDIHIPEAWEKVNLAGLEGVILVVGATDVGKSTFARYLFGRLQAELPSAATGARTAYVDADPGQTSLGPPATLTLAFDLEKTLNTPAGPTLRRYFIGGTTPRGHMLEMLVGAGRLVGAAQERGASTILYDTSGLVDPAQGGLALKLAETDLLRPAAVFAIQRESELDPLLIPLRRSRRTKVVELAPAAGARRREKDLRREHRRRQYAGYFAAARPLRIPWTELGVFPYPRFRLNQLAALEDEAGFSQGLGIILEIDRPNREVTLLTPLPSLAGVTALRLGEVLVNPETFRDEIF